MMTRPIDYLDLLVEFGNKFDFWSRVSKSTYVKSLYTVYKGGRGSGDYIQRFTRGGGGVGRIFVVST